jgi:hypothetical protein
MAPEKTPKNSNNFVCELCHFKCFKNSDYNRHLTTSKHLKLINANEILFHASEKNAEIDKVFICSCGKKYNHNSSYYRHKKNCNFEPESYSENDTIKPPSMFDNKDELILILINENKEFKNMLLEQQKQMMEVIKNGTNNVTNSNNKTKFNLTSF